MRFEKTLSTSAFVLISILTLTSLSYGESPASCRIDGVPLIKQQHNYCGPATLAALLQFNGEKTTQDDIGKCVYDPVGCATNGADMLLYARDKGYAAYSWNSSLADAKKKIAAGVPILVLQENSTRDPSGHFRILTGYDDSKGKFYIMDPYYQPQEMSYQDCEKLWKPMGHWALMVVPKDKDTFSKELNDSNAVVHMDLSSAMLKQGHYSDALTEAKIALALEPSNTYVKQIMNKINKAMGAGKKR